MKKMVAIMLVVVMVGAFAGQAQAYEKGRGGAMGFFAGCCLGMRSGAAYNDGKTIYWREWMQLIPVASLIFGIMNGIDGANGVTTADYADMYGSQYF
jgi:hypothetical protein